MASLGFRDRTSEFTSIAESIRKRNEIVVKPRTTQSLIKQKIGVHKVAADISRQTYETTMKLGELTKLAKSTSLFNDPTEKIQELVYIIKQDIQYLDKKIVELDQLVKSQRAGNNQAHSHSDTIVDALKSNLRNTTQNFTKVLEMRSETMKAQQEKREKFTGSRLSVSAQTSAAGYGGQGLTPFGGQGLTPFDAQYADDEGEVALPMVTMQSSVLEQRSSAVRAIEQTIHDLQRIFQHLALLTHEQDAQIRRIDDNVNSTVLNVEGAHKQLVSYLAKVSNDRWLILKVFGILLLFIFVFVVFFA